MAGKVAGFAEKVEKESASKFYWHLTICRLFRGLK